MGEGESPLKGLIRGNKMRDMILVVGAGKSGVSAVSLLSSNQEKPVLFDSNAELNIEEVREKLDPCAKDVPIYKTELPQNVLDEVKELILSPGVPIDSEFVEGFRKEGVKISGEIELAFSYEKGTLIAVTGTNGKTTTTALAGKIIDDYTGKAFVVGNIGIPYTGTVSETGEDTVTIAEISSFQLETAESFRPHIAAILNITPDHLNRHHTMERYILEKEKIAANQDKDDFLILNYDDSELREFGKKACAKVIFFSSREHIEDGLYYSDGTIYLNRDGQDTAVVKREEMNIIGLHNMENAMAAIALGLCYGVPIGSIANSVREFKAVEHRIEFVREFDGVRYYDDSKGTNVDAAIKGIEAMDRPTCLIGGGYDKEADYSDWIKAFGGKVKKLVLIGQTAQKIADCAKQNGFEDYIITDSLENAVRLCRENAKPGDAVLLSPACASWGMFNNYEERGDIFKDLVRSLD